MSLIITQSNDYSYSNQNKINKLLVQNMSVAAGGGEKFRLFVNNKLKYGKCRVIFRLNLPTDGSGKTIPCDMPDEWEWYYFYDDGFYEYSDEFRNYVFIRESLIDFKYSNVFFKGWWTIKDNEYKTKFEDASDIDNWFCSEDYNERQINIPTLYLYARWEVKLVTVIIHNIIRQTPEIFETSPDKYTSFIGRSSFKWNSFNITASSYRVKVKAGTDIIKYLDSHITDIKYPSWITNYFENWYSMTNNNGSISYQRLATAKVAFENYSDLDENSIRTWPAFIGWAQNEFSTSYESSLIINFDTWDQEEKTYEIYPIFQALVFWPSIKECRSGQDYYGGGLFRINPGTSYSDFISTRYSSEHSDFWERVDNETTAKGTRYYVTWDWDYEDLRLNSFNSPVYSAETIIVRPTNMRFEQY